MSDRKDFLVTIADVRVAGFCVRGAKSWFESRDINFRTFLQDGVSSLVLLGTDDPFALRAVEAGERRVKDAGHG